MDIGQKIFEIRRDEGLSQAEFADKFHVTRQAVSNWENGKNYPDMDILMRISDEYDITFDELIKSDKELIRSIDRSHKVAARSIKIFSVIGIMIVAIILIKLMPRIISQFYYDPNELAAVYTDEDGGTWETTRLELDARVYSELYLPEKKYDMVDAVSLGYGKYNFTLSESMWVEPTKQKEVSGVIDKNHIQFFDPAKFRMPEGDSFMRGIEGETEEDAISESKMEIEGLNNDDNYIAYVTLKDDIDYEAACKWMNGYEVCYPWACVVTDADEFVDIIGMYIEYSGIPAAYDTKKYPYLIGIKDPFAEEPFDDVPLDAESAKRHFVSMLRYQIDNPGYIAMVWNEDGSLSPDKSVIDWLGRKARFVEKNGIKVYGFAVEADRATLLKISESDKVYRIMIEK